MEKHIRIAAVVAAGLVGTGALAVPAASASTVRPVETRQAGTDVYAKGKVTARSRLAVRAKPTTHSERYDWLRPNQVVDLKCSVRGESVKGDRTWYRLGLSTPEFVSGHYIKIVKGRVSPC